MLGRDAALSGVHSSGRSEDNERFQWNTFAGGGGSVALDFARTSTVTEVMRQVQTKLQKKRLEQLIKSDYHVSVESNLI